MKKMASSKWLVASGVVLAQVISCMQLEYIDASPSSSAGELLSSSSILSSSSLSASPLSSSSLSFEVKVSEHELEHKGLSFYDAILLCNKMSIEEGLDTLYQHDKPVFTDDSLFWLPNIRVLENRTGYRLPTKEEWTKAMESGEIEKLYEDVGEWLYSEVNSEYSVFELAPSFLKTVGLHKKREGYPVFGIRVVRIQFLSSTI